jgi:predicted ester cyclase
MRQVPTPLAVLAVLFLLAGCTVPAQGPLASDAASSTISEQNKDVVRQVFAAIDAGDLERVGELLPTGFALHVLGQPEPFDRDFIFEAIKAFYQAFPDNTHVIEALVAEGNSVAVRLTQHATHGGDYEGAVATGKKVTIPAIHMMTIADGQIQEWWALEDNLGLMTQIGMRLVPAKTEQ